MCAKAKFVQYRYSDRGAPLLAGSSFGRTCWGHPAPSSGLVKANFFDYYDFYNRLMTAIRFAAAERFSLSTI